MKTFHKHPPLDIVCVTSSALRKIEKHPHSWTFASTPPPWTLPVWRHPHSKGEGGDRSWSRTFCNRFSVSGQVQGGGHRRMGTLWLGGQRGWFARNFTQITTSTPPLDIARVTSSTLPKFEKHTPTTLGHSQAPPLGHCLCDVIINIPKGLICSFLWPIFSSCFARISPTVCPNFTRCLPEFGGAAAPLPPRLIRLWGGGWSSLSTHTHTWIRHWIKKPNQKFVPVPLLLNLYLPIELRASYLMRSALLTTYCSSGGIPWPSLSNL